MTLGQKDLFMHWTKPDFEEISLSMEVTAYANTDGELPLPIDSTGQLAGKDNVAAPDNPVTERND